MVSAVTLRRSLVQSPDCWWEISVWSMCLSGFHLSAPVSSQNPKASYITYSLIGLKIVPIGCDPECVSVNVCDLQCGGMFIA